MKYLLALLALFTGTFTSAQSIDISGTTTRAVVIGISDYQDKDIPDLRFADRDAEAFANFLRSPAGGSLDGDHLKVLTNDQATAGQVASALYWLVEESKEGDQVIIYFSGHGDVERKFLGQPGFLLCWDAPPKVYMAGGVVEIGMLQTVISTLSLENKAHVTVVTDACRSGKLAGSAINGSQLTNANLAKQFANEIKILSCQPNEYSIEGEQWGGGRGAFSYHLVDGLYGLADGNADQSVTLMEIGRYLEDKVTTEVAPVSQVPMAIGNRTERLANVDMPLLAALRSGKSNQMVAFSPVESRGLEDDVLATVDTSVRKMYFAFKQAIKYKHFFEPKGTNADELYEKLAAVEELKPLHNHLRRNYAAALQDDAQTVLNLYLKTDTAELAKMYRLDSSYALYPRYLERAADLLGESHYMYGKLKARQYFFQGLFSKLKRNYNFENRQIKYNSPEWKSLISEEIKLNEDALAYDSLAAYAYYELAWLNWSLSQKNVLKYCEKALEISPDWGLALNLQGYVYSFTGETQKAQGILKKAIEVSPDYAMNYSRMAMTYYYAGLHEEAIFWAEKGLAVDSNDASNLEVIAHLYSSFDEFEKAEAMFRMAYSIQLKSNPDAHRLLLWIGQMLLYQRKSREALEILEEADNWQNLTWIGLAKIDLGEYDAGLDSLKKAFKSDSRDTTSQLEYLGWAYLKMKRLEEADSCFNQAFKMALRKSGGKDNFHGHVLVWYLAFEGETERALEWLEKILDTGNYRYSDFQYEKVLAEMRKTQKFKDLMKKYFPLAPLGDQTKD